MAECMCDQIFTDNFCAVDGITNQTSMCHLGIGCMIYKQSVVCQQYSSWDKNVYVLF